jgi:spermidine/putrescine transport system substrate-binding protein
MMMKRILPLVLLAALSACSKKAPEAAAPAAAKPAAINVYTWSNYFSPDAVAQFEKESGVKVNFSYFSSNEELMAKLQAGARGYDVILPSGFVVKALKTLGLLQPLKAGAFPEAKHLSARFRNPDFDRDLEYAVPFAWGTTGLAINKAKVKQKVDSWAAVFQNPALKGQITMLDDPSGVIAAALKFQGQSLNEIRPDALKKAQKLLMEQKKILKAYTSEAKALLEAGDVAIAQAYSSDVGQAMRTNPNIEFIIPKEGAELWVDTLAIPVGAASPETAREFIRFMMRPAVAEMQSKFLCTNPVVELPASSEVVKEHTKLHFIPDTALMARMEVISDDPALHDAHARLWTELKAE